MAYWLPRASMTNQGSIARQTRIRLTLWTHPSADKAPANLDGRPTGWFTGLQHVQWSKPIMSPKETERCRLLPTHLTPRTLRGNGPRWSRIFVLNRRFSCVPGRATLYHEFIAQDWAMAIPESSISLPGRDGRHGMTERSR